jgi:hypothetical protein
VLVSQAGRFGGWTFSIKEGKPAYLDNDLGLDRYAEAAERALPEGEATVRMAFAYDGEPRLGGGGTATLYIDGKEVGSGRVEKTQFAIWSGDETANVGIDRETSVSRDDTEQTAEARSINANTGMKFIEYVDQCNQRRHQEYHDQAARQEQLDQDARQAIQGRHPNRATDSHVVEARP